MERVKQSFTWVSFGLSLLALITLIGLVSCSRKEAMSGSQDLMSQISHRGKLVAGVKFDSKPFGFLDQDGKLKGYDVDLIREVAKRLLGNANAVEFQQVLSSTRIIAINQGTLDLVAATMTITPEREEIIDFSQPYYTAGQAIIVPKESTVRNVSALKNHKILFVMGTTSEKNIKKLLPQAQYIGFKTSTEAFSALKAGRGDAMTSDDTILSGFISDSCQFRMLPGKLSQEPYGLGFKQDAQKSTESFRNKVNDILSQMQQDGTLERLKVKWMGAYEHPKACQNS